MSALAIPDQERGDSAPPRPLFRRQPRAGAQRRGRRKGRSERVERVVYTTLALAGASLVVIGVGLVFLPAALVLGGIAAGGLGLIGLGVKGNR